MKAFYNIKRKISICLLIGIIAISSGCSLDPELTSTYTEDTLWKDENSVELYLNSFYPLLGEYYGAAIEDDGYSDIMKMNLAHANQNLVPYGSVTITPINNPFDNWGWGYTWVTQCNRFLDGLSKKGQHLPEDVRLRAEAEIRFFRAHVYFVMARRYGASLIIFRQLPELGNGNNPLSSPDQCWDFIAEDLDFAAKNLNINPAKKGKLSRGAAFGLKARAMLYAGRWKAASDAAQDLFDLKMYDLYPSYDGLFKIRRSQNIENKESIIEVGFMAPDLAYTFDAAYSPSGDAGAMTSATPTEDIVSQYQMADGSNFDWNNPIHAANPYAGREERFYSSILYNDADWKGRKIETFVGGKDGWSLGGTSTMTGYFLRKFLDEDMTTFTVNDFTYYYMRYAEVLLIYAEAMAQQGHLTPALKALNDVRKRAGFKTDVTANSVGDFMTLLRRERMIELAFEGHRFWDLRRWDLAKSELNNRSLKGVKPTRESNNTFTYEVIDCDSGRKRIYLDKYKRFPIPSSELESNKMIQQFDEWK
ncbi:RagB/SusD family nutrient uptake outer membrane protein [Prevotella sp. 10(H)]|uniref:RagB/SusD family nutrient uptake outer membrane protein n=1 Tax=Prevotella sp. 10(H) TaxID=1158294 RepID=UPI0004A776F2|nr:RagB/SusD family nutrient uptake outer membrane protein [Prevotella sp. 10(H)]